MPTTMLRSWDLKLELSRIPGAALYLQIAEKIIAEIQQGRLTPETVMPGTRELAECLNVNRKTVMLTYDELIAQGWLVTESRRGTFVSKDLPKSGHNQAQAIADAAIAQARALGQTPNYGHPQQDILDFSEGLLDSRLIPFEILARAFRRALVTQSRNNYKHFDDPRGNLELRNAIASMLNMERGLHTSADHICMVSGAQMAFFIAARILTQASDCVVFENLTFPSAREAFKSCGSSVLQVGVDEYGMRIDELEILCQKNKIRAVFVTPQYHYPTTVTMSNDRRKALLRLAHQYDFMIIEEDHDHAFHFSESPIFPIASQPDSERVIYIGSLSKVLAQGLRVGYIVANTSFIQKCAAQVMLIDRQGNNASELAISELMYSGEIKRHIRRMAKIYMGRRNILRELIQSELHPWVNFIDPKGGLAFWLAFKQPMDMKMLAEEAAKQKIRFSFGSYFADGQDNIQGIRLSFANLNDKELFEGISRLKRVLEAC